MNALKWTGANGKKCPRGKHVTVSAIFADPGEWSQFHCAICDHRWSEREPGAKPSLPLGNVESDDDYLVRVCLDPRFANSLGALALTDAWLAGKRGVELDFVAYSYILPVRNNGSSSNEYFLSGYGAP